MGLTERHWFENEDVPENYEWALEDAVYNSRTNKKLVWETECMNKKVDMVEVVRCKHCEYHLNCDYWIKNGDDWFCADGKRREDDG